jgi:hypothetical protein
MPAWIISSMSGPMPAITSGDGGAPASMSRVALCMLMNRIVFFLHSIVGWALAISTRGKNFEGTTRSLVTRAA